MPCSLYGEVRLKKRCCLATLKAQTITPAFSSSCAHARTGRLAVPGCPCVRSRPQQFQDVPAVELLCTQPRSYGLNSRDRTATSFPAHSPQQPGASAYAVDPATISSSASSLTFSLVNSNTNVELAAVVQFLDGTARLTVQDAAPRHPRHAVKGVLPETLSTLPFSITSKVSQSPVVRSGYLFMQL